MTNLKAIELENGQFIYVQTDESIHFIDTPNTNVVDEAFERKGSKDNDFSNKTINKLSNVISSMTDTAQHAIDQSTLGNIKTATLEFGIKLGGEAGIPFIANGKTEGSINIKIEFSPTTAKSSKG